MPINRQAAFYEDEDEGIEYSPHTDGVEEVIDTDVESPFSLRIPISPRIPRGFSFEAQARAASNLITFIDTEPEMITNETKLKQVFNTHSPDVGFVVGLEFEYEAPDRITELEIQSLCEMTNMFNSTRDGSLRGKYSGELVSVPLSVSMFDSIKPTIASIEDYLSASHSSRTSTHIHVNVGEMSFTQFKYFLFLSLVCDLPMCDIYAPDRKHNNFSRCSSIDVNITDTLTSKNWLGMGNQLRERVISKYLTINLSNIKRRGYGTLEFRCFHGVDSANDLSNWHGSLKILHDKAMEEAQEGLKYTRGRFRFVRALADNSALYEFYCTVFGTDKVDILDMSQYQEVVDRLIYNYLG